jgi:predicted DNA-binding ribbon-helix-helix protein
LFAPDDKPSILESRNVTVGSRRTSMRLEPQMWDALESIARLEGMTINNLCTQIDFRRRKTGLTSATRVFIVSYYRHLVRHFEGDGARGDVALALQVLDVEVGRRPGRVTDPQPVEHSDSSDVNWPAEG